MAESNILISIDMDKGMRDSSVAEVAGKYPHNRTSSLSPPTNCGRHDLRAYKTLAIAGKVGKGLRNLGSVESSCGNKLQGNKQIYSPCGIVSCRGGGERNLQHRHWQRCQASGARG
jgi:hypothetical protein